jgi:hypothetical protein
MRRLKKLLHGVRREASGVFLTFTHHELFPTPSELKDELDLMGKWLRRRYPSCSIVWKLEPQERGSPHIHAMVFGPEFIPIGPLSEAWHRISGETSDKHRKSGVDVEPMVNQDGKLQAYLAKYMSDQYDVWPCLDEDHVPDEWASPGRWWGVIGREDLPTEPWDEAPVYLDRSEAQFLIRELLDEWEADVPDGVIPPTLTINTRGDPTDVLDDLLSRL